MYIYNHIYIYIYITPKVINTTEAIISKSMSNVINLKIEQFLSYKSVMKLKMFLGLD